MVKSRLSTESIMARRGFGTLKVIRNGISVIVDNCYLDKNGAITKEGLEFIQNSFKSNELEMA